jgi:predicted ATPase/DNA-binding CsgD family transcriptional regulator
VQGRIYGRDEAVARLRTMVLAAPGIVTVTGTGGVGKTTVVEWATSDPGSWSPWLGERTVVALADVGRADLVLPAIASALGVTGSTRDPLVARLATALTGGGHLLVLDNFEHVLGAAADLARLVKRTPDLRVVVTSRAPLRVRDERVMELSPLPLPTAGDTLEQPASALFVEVATRHDPALVIAGMEATVASICRHVDGVPLAIELAAARAATLSPARIEALLAGGAHLAVLRHGPNDLPTRQRDLEATIAWSHDLLEAAEQRMLAGLCGFTGAFDFDDVTAVVGGAVGDCLDELSALVDAHLVLAEQTDGDRRYRLPVPVREFCAGRLAADPDATRAWAAAHRARVLATTSAAMRDLDGPDGAGALARLAAGEGDLVRALEIAVATDDATLAVAVAPALAALWLHRGVSPAVRPLLTDAAAVAGRAGASDAERAHVQGWRAMLDAEGRTEGRDPARIEKSLLQAADLARTAGDVDVRLRTLLFLTLAARSVNNFDSAVAAADEGIALAGAEHRLAWCGRFEAEAGMILQKLGENDRARELGVQALRHGRAADDVGVIVRAVAVLRPPGPPPKEPPVACPTLDQALALAVAAGDVSAARYLYPMAAVDAIYRDEPAVAAQRCADGLSEAIRSGSTDYGRINVLVLSGVAIAAGELELAAELQGMVAGEWPTLRLGLAMVTQRSGTWLLDSLRQRMGAAAYDRASARGAAHMASALPWAHDHATRLAADRAPDRGLIDVLTARERTVLQLVAGGLSNKEIAAKLGITPKTAMHHTSAVYRKLGVAGRTAAVAVAYRHGLTSDP